MDIHAIPQHNFEPGHQHYDIRFLFEADPAGDTVIISDESHDVTWIPLEDVAKINPEVSIQRMIKKTILMKEKKTNN